MTAKKHFTFCMHRLRKGAVMIGADNNALDIDRDRGTI